MQIWDETEFGSFPPFDRLCSQCGLPDFRHPGRSPTQLSNLELTLLDLLCQFDASDNNRRIAKALQPQHRTQPVFHSSVVLLHDVIQVFTAAYFHSLRQFHFV